MNSILENSIIDIINNFNDFFLIRKNVIGLGLGFKYIKDFNTNEPCLHVFVRKKLPLNNLHINEIIPKSFLNIKTDIIETGDFYDSNEPILSNSSLLSSKVNFSSFNRPLEAGYSISCSLKRSGGTLGAIVFDNENNIPYILSNNHVLADYNKAPKDTPILQPATIYCESAKKYIVASLYKYIQLNFHSNNRQIKDANYTDSAIAKIHTNDKIEYTNKIYKIGTITGTNKVSLKSIVKKVGKKTGYTESTIISINAFCSTTPEKGKICNFRNQIVAKKFSDVGDSGSLVVDNHNKAIGLIFGNTPITTFINPIDPIINFFNIHF